MKWIVLSFIILYLIDKILWDCSYGDDFLREEAAEREKKGGK